MFDFLSQMIDKFGRDKIISLYNGFEYSYGEYDVACQILSQGFLEKGIQTEVVAVIMDDSPLLIAVFLSLIAIKAKPLLISPKTPYHTIKQITDNATCRYMIYESGELTYDIPDISVLTVTGFNDKSSVFISVECEESGFDREPTLIDENVSYVALTSGSNGTPKIVMHAIEEMMSAIENYAKDTLQITEHDVLFSIPKATFSFGLANSLFFSFGLGAKAILYRSTINEKEIYEIVDKYKVSYFFAVPTTYTRLLNTTGDDNKCMINVKMFVSAGEYLPQTLNDEWKEHYGKYIVDSVGCSETGSAYLVNMEGGNKAGSAGRAVQGYDLRLLENNNVNDTTGVLIVSSRSNAIGYLNDRKATEEKFKQGFIVTGDIFRKDEDGFYWFLGRSDDMVKKNGRWVSLTELNQALEACGKIQKAVSFKIEEKNALYAVVETDDNKFDSAQTMKELRERIEHYKLPDQIFEIKQIPLNYNGKVDYGCLKTMFGER